MKLLAVLIALPVAAHAAPPGAGSLLQQIGPAQALPREAPRVRIVLPDGEPLPPAARFMVKKIVLSGNGKPGIPALHELVRDAEGKMLSLADLDRLAAKITAYCRAHGRPFARAFIPEQTIRNGEVVIEVVDIDGSDP